ncbi:hypothetical protein AA313_de0208448 [Arthrobotrys entomopaga]|nr:hypothetical protein AA313_de0208448 [Arthrobotrys entomopaga]
MSISSRVPLLYVGNDDRAMEEISSKEHEYSNSPVKRHSSAIFSRIRSLKVIIFSLTVFLGFILFAFELYVSGLPYRPHPHHRPERDRPLILYVYRETLNARKNALFFINHGLHDAADFVFILNGPNTINQTIPIASNIKIVHRKNECYDLGAYGEVLTANDDELIRNYKKFIFLNASIRGPFMPTWSRECWSDAYLAKVTPETKLVGMTFNCIPKWGKRHVQSMILATDRAGLDALLPIFSTCFAGHSEAVYGESNTTQAIFDAGYKVMAMMTAFSSEENYAQTCKNGDILKQDGYFGGNLHPYETIFQKANRNMGQDTLAHLTEWTDKARYSSYEVCGKTRRELEEKPLGGWGRWKEPLITGKGR